MRWTDSAMLSQDPLIGVYSGRMPCWNNQSTMLQLKWPARLSQTRSMRRGGNGVVGSWPSQVAQRARAGRWSSASVSGGRLASTAVSSAWSQGCSTALALLVTPLTRTRPEAGWKRVRSLAVPWRMCSWG